MFQKNEAPTSLTIDHLADDAAEKILKNIKEQDEYDNAIEKIKAGKKIELQKIEPGDYVLVRNRTWIKFLGLQTKDRVRPFRGRVIKHDESETNSVAKFSSLAIKEIRRI